MDEYQNGMLGKETKHKKLHIVRFHSHAILEKAKLKTESESMVAQGWLSEE